MPSWTEVRTFAQLHLKERAHDHPAQDEGMGVVSLGYEPAAFEAAVRAFADRYDITEEADRTARVKAHVDLFLALRDELEIAGTD